MAASSAVCDSLWASTSAPSSGCARNRHAGLLLTQPEARRPSASDYQYRRAPVYRSAYQPVMLEIFTTSPVCGAWMNWLPPM